LLLQEHSAQSLFFNTSSLFSLNLKVNEIRMYDYSGVFIQIAENHCKNGDE
jgi:hypothetical protein